MKKIIYILLTITLFACNETPFIPNVDNDLMVGNWEIIEVDDADALVSKEEFLTSIMHEKYKEGYVFTFEKGANFKLKNESGTEVLKGQYAIGSENKTLSINVLPEENQFEYEMVKSDKIIQLNIQTPGELVNLKIEKK